MLVTLLKSKIHRATITQAELDYAGSLTLDPDLMEAADMLPFERVQVLDINNGARFETYIHRGGARQRDGVPKRPGRPDGSGRRSRYRADVRPDGRRGGEVVPAEGCPCRREEPD